MNTKPSRMRREQQTIEAMIGIFCCGQHGETRGRLCPDCATLIEYARRRLDRCPFQEKKTTCANCPVHCYTPQMRNKVRAVMRYAGRRMVYRHPLLALFHFLDGFRENPQRPDRP